MRTRSPVRNDIVSLEPGVCVLDMVPVPEEELVPDMVPDPEFAIEPLCVVGMVKVVPSSSVSWRDVGSKLFTVPSILCMPPLFELAPPIVEVDPLDMPELVPELDPQLEPD